MILEDNEVALAGEEFDQPPSPLKRFVIIAATARSGSHMLSRLFKHLGYGIALEYYHGNYRDRFARRWGVEPGSPRFLADFLDALIRHRTSRGFCVIKCLPTQFGALSAGLAACGDIPGLCYVHLWRRDSLAQAISLRLAYQSGVWNFTAEPTTPPNLELDIADLDALSRTRRQLFMYELGWRVHLKRCGVAVAHVAYEDLVEDRERELRRLVAFLDPERRLNGPLMLSEPTSPEGLWERQHLTPAERQALRRAYEEKFGAATPLPDP